MQIEECAGQNNHQFNKESGISYFIDDFENIYERTLQKIRNRENLSSAVIEEQPRIQKRAISLQDKYRPNSLHDLIGDSRVNREIFRWFKEWREFLQTKNAKSKKPEVFMFSKSEDKSPFEQKNVLFSGVAGTGKTTFAKTLAKVFNFDILIINGSDERAGAALFNKIKNFISYKNISIDLKDGSETLNPFLKMVLIDEIDGTLDSSENSAVSYLLAKSESSEGAFLKSLPIIFICNNPYVRGLAKLRENVKIFHFKKDRETVLDRVRCILEQEGIIINENDLIDILESCSFDIRSILICIEFYTGNKMTGMNKNNNNKDVVNENSNFFEFMEKIFLKKSQIGIFGSSISRLQLTGTYINYFKTRLSSNPFSVKDYLYFVLRDSALNPYFQRTPDMRATLPLPSLLQVRYLLSECQQQENIQFEFPLNQVNLSNNRKNRRKLIKNFAEPLFCSLYEKLCLKELCYKLMNNLVFNSNIYTSDNSTKLIILLSIVRKLGLRAVLNEKKGPKEAKRSIFFREDPEDGTFSIEPDLDTLFSGYQRDSIYRLSQNTCLTINTYRFLVDKNREEIEHFISNRKLRTVFDSSDNRKLQYRPQHSTFHYHYHEASTSGVVYPLKFSYFIDNK